jgi:PTS system nitrogen regulatory IIA component
MMNISQYLDPKLILLSLDKTERNEILETLIDKLYREGKLKQKNAFYRAILEREKIVSTSLGIGVAIPHAKLPAYNDFFIAMAVLKQEIDWGGFDHTPVRLVFMIGGPDNKPTEYLQLLSAFTGIIRNEDVRKKILTANSPDAIMALFKT